MADSASPRRSFITSLGAAVAAAGVGVAAAEAQTAAPRTASPFKPARHADDDWMDKLPGSKHRMVIDAVTPHGAGEAILFANNLYEGNKNAYGVDSKDMAIIIVMRHFATPFAFTDAIWNKYGKAMGDMLDFKDPKSKESPTTNLYNVAAYGLALPNLGSTIDSVLKRGAVFAVCEMATKFAIGGLAGPNGDRNAMFTEFSANMYPGSHMVPAGVIAVNRAQERGYTLIYAG
jgi:hypothetical protein